MIRTAAPFSIRFSGTKPPGSGVIPAQLQPFPLHAGAETSAKTVTILRMVLERGMMEPSFGLASASARRAEKPCIDSIKLQVCQRSAKGLTPRARVDQGQLGFTAAELAENVAAR